MNFFGQHGRKVSLSSIGAWFACDQRCNPLVAYEARHFPPAEIIRE